MPDGGTLSLKLRRQQGNGTRHKRRPYSPSPTRGPGIDPVIRSRIFEPLFTTRAEGTGLGLAVSAGIVHQANGRIAVESPAGGGARFRVELPVVDRPPESH
ncbi:MAG: ATP-binding protein [Gammaproteobacteria bacterium]|nr:ATP-binding protein [Gammaproteobacteria bacterium]